MIKLNAKQLREASEEQVESKLKGIKRNPLYFILENIYDTYNVGGLYRLADALAVEKMYLCGRIETPPNHRIKKASIGTYKAVPWEYKATACEAIEELRMKGDRAQVPLEERAKASRFSKGVRGQDPSSVQIIAVEQAKRSKPYTEIEYKAPLALIFGNETYGVLSETLKLCDEIAEIPMYGVNVSLNVIVSAGIVAYHSINKLTK